MPLSRADVQAKLLAYRTTYAKREPVELPWAPEFSAVKDEAGNIIEDNQLRVREMMGDESMAFVKEQEQDANRALGRVIAKCLLMPDGTTPVFDEAMLANVMKELGSSVLMPLMNTINTLSGNTPTAQADAAKNLPATPPAASTLS